MTLPYSLGVALLLAIGCGSVDSSRPERKVVAKKSAVSTQPPPLSAAEYARLSVEVLTVTSEAWSTTHAPPSAEVLGPLFARAGITPAQYDTYYSARHAEVDAYLAAHPETKRVIAEREHQIRSAIVGGEPP
jgi:hypothetical protein